MKKITYKEIDFHVIKDSDKNLDSVTMFKEFALKYYEVSDFLNNMKFDERLRKKWECKNCN